MEPRWGSRRSTATPIFASLLIAEGMNVVFVSRQLGHANPTITLGVYAHLFERADHTVAARDALEASYAAISGPPSSCLALR